MRKCGTCSACCRWPSVPEIGKPPRVTCKHLHARGHGCTIYADRPGSCSKYRCSWLRGAGDRDDQPDTCNVLIDRKMTRFGVVLVAKPLEPGATTTPEGRGAVTRTARDDDLLCLIVDYEDNETVVGAAGPRELVDRFRREMGPAPVTLGGPKDYVDHLTRRIVGEGMSDGR